MIVLPPFLSSAPPPMPDPSSPDPSPDPWGNWWPMFVAGAVGIVIVVVVSEFKRDKQKHRQEATLSVGLGIQAFDKVMSEGVKDSELGYDQKNIHSGMAPFHKTFSDAKVLGISPTELAVSGRYFGAEVLPIKIRISYDGVIRLLDGRHRLLAAKMAGASHILADVSLTDRDGEIVLERQNAVRLL